MKRIVGLKSKSKSKGSVNPRGINDIVGSIDSKAKELDGKVADCEVELRKISNQLKTVSGPSAKQALQNKAKSILIRKKRFEQQAEQMKEKSFNLDSLGTSISSAADVVVIAGVMKDGTKQLKKDLKKIDLDKIEDVQEDMENLIELTEDVQGAIAGSYNVPQDIDDAELDAQLELLGDEIVADNDPTYIDEAMKLMPPRNLSRNRRDENGPGGPSAIEVDEFGLPLLDTTKPSTSTTHIS